MISAWSNAYISREENIGGLSSISGRGDFDKLSRRG